MHTSKYSRNKAQNIQNARLAIEILKSEGKRPTAKAVSEISGISVVSLYSYEELRGEMALNGMGSNPRYPRVTKGVKTAFGQKLNSRRVELGMTQEQLADAIGFHPGTIRKLERGFHAPGKSTIDLLALGLKCPVEYFSSNNKSADIDSIAEPKKARELYKLRPAVGSYVSYLIDNYFSRPESISTVQIEMSYDIEGFSLDLFKQAVNLLVKDKVLLRHAVLVDHYYQEPNREPELDAAASALKEHQSSDEPAEVIESTRGISTSLVAAASVDSTPEKFIIFNVTKNKFETAIDEAALEQRIEDLLARDDYKLQIYHLTEVAQPERKIARRRIS